MVLILFFMRV